jgi:hypothetical protein
MVDTIRVAPTIMAISLVDVKRNSKANIVIKVVREARNAR